MKLTTKTIKKINSNNIVKARLCDAFKKHHNTIQRWIDNNDVMLTNLGALKIYKEELGIDQEQAIEQ